MQVGRAITSRLIPIRWQRGAELMFEFCFERAGALKISDQFHHFLTVVLWPSLFPLVVLSYRSPTADFSLNCFKMKWNVTKLTEKKEYNTKPKITDHKLFMYMFKKVWNVAFTEMLRTFILHVMIGVSIKHNTSYSISYNSETYERDF